MLLNAASPDYVKRDRRFINWLWVGLACFELVMLAGCGPAEKSAVRPLERMPVVEDTNRFTKESIGVPFEGRPWISHVNVVDLDRDGLDDILACDDKLNG